MIGRWRFVLTLVVAVFSLSRTLAQDKIQPKTGSNEQTAKTFVELLDKGEFVKATERFDAAMLKALPRPGS